MSNSIMGHDLQAMERQGMIETIASLRSHISAMESDFARCAIGTSPCFFCAHDNTCAGPENCHFKWNKHD